MADVTTREATAAHCDRVVALWQTCGLTRPWNDPVADFDRAVSGPTSAVLVREVAEHLVASAMVGYDGHRGWVYYVSVDPDHRGRGHGAGIMAAAEEWLRRLGAPKLQLMVRAENTVAAGFYEAIGYEPGQSQFFATWLKPKPPADPPH
jgi:ribosomal protein S18 acetylase RimI-like enzyme